MFALLRPLSSLHPPTIITHLLSSFAQISTLPLLYLFSDCDVGIPLTVAECCSMIKDTVPVADKMVNHLNVMKIPPSAVHRTLLILAESSSIPMLPELLYISPRTSRYCFSFKRWIGTYLHPCIM